MPERKYLKFCQSLADAFLSSDPGRAAEAYAHPLAVYFRDSVRVELDRDATAQAIRERASRARASGAVSIESRVHDVRKFEDGRLRLNVTWDFIDGLGAVIGTTSMSYFCREADDGAVTIELVEFERLAFLEDRDWPGTLH